MREPGSGTVRIPVVEQRRELKRVLQSPQFRRSPKLQRFLTVVCEYYFENRSSELKEFLIATEAFGKGPNFDPTEDSIVRVQARKVRRLLLEYYEKEGRESRVVLKIPVGSYAPVFDIVPDSVGVTPERNRGFRWAFVIIAAVAVLVPSLIYSYSHLSIRAGTPEVWQRFLESDVPTILVLSNPVIPRTPALVAADTNQVSVSTVNPDEFTGMGEAVALHLITRLFETAKHKLTVKQSRFVTQDDVRRHHLILLGGRRVNPWTERLGRDLHFASRDEGFTVAGQQPVHSTEFDAKTGKLARDLGVIALRKDETSGHWRLFLFGVHSQGTQATAEAATSALFYSKIRWPGRDAPPAGGFQILIGVTLSEGLPLDVTPLIVHTDPSR